MSASNRGTIVAGIWLITIGAVFLAQAALDLPWDEAWPLWVIAVGVGSGLSSLVALSGRRRSASIILWALVWPAIITVVGVLLFVDLAGLADIDAVGILVQWWPLTLIAIGLIVLVGALWPRQRGVIDQVAVPVGGAAARAAPGKPPAAAAATAPPSPAVPCSIDRRVSMAFPRLGLYRQR